MAKQRQYAGKYFQGPSAYNYGVIEVRPIIHPQNANYNA